MKICYADPPYVGQAKKLYGDQPNYAGEVDHVQLIATLVTSFPDGWALSCSTPSLRFLLPLCPAEVRIGAWVKPFHAFKRGVRPAYAWEPVIFLGGRNPPRVPHPPPLKDGKQTTPKDFVRAAEEVSWLESPAVPENITLKRGLCGAKPAAFCFWLFDLMGMRPEDELVDLFPGTGAVTGAWEQFKQAQLEVSTEPGSTL